MLLTNSGSDDCTHLPPSPLLRDEIDSALFLEPQVPHRYRWQMHNPHIYFNIAMQEPGLPSTIYFTDTRKATTSVELRAIGASNPLPPQGLNACTNYLHTNEYSHEKSCQT